MTQTDKDLLLKDLCARLPYGVKVEYNGEKYKIANVSICNETITIYGERGYPMEVEIKKVKPYLFPLSSMPEEQLLELSSISFENSIDSSIKTLNWCYKNHFDIYNLIPMGLAIDATGLNIY